MAQIFLHFGDREMSPISMSNKEIFNLTSHFFREIADLPLGHEVHVTAQLLLGSADGIKSQTISTFSVVLDRIRRLWQPLSGQNISWKRWLFQPKSSQTSAASREKKFRENDGTTVQIFTEISWNRSSVDRSSLVAQLASLFSQILREIRSHLIGGLSGQIDPIFGFVWAQNFGRSFAVLT